MAASTPLPAPDGVPAAGVPATAPVTATAHRSNNLDALRLIGALAVIFGHAYHIVGRPFENPVVAGYPVQTLGVVIFFSISGYLITASWSRTKNPVSYFAARSLRIFPALVLVVLVCMFVIGPLVTVLPMGQYFDAPNLWSYLGNIILRPQYELPGVWGDHPYPNAVNGSLWTLPAEFFCYLLVPLVFLFPKVARIPVIALLLAASVWYSMTPPMDSAVIWHSRISDNALMWVFFAAGAILRLLAERGMRFRTDVAVGLLAVYLVIAGTLPQHTTKIAWIFLPYIVLTVGLASTPYVRRASRYGDLSYGLYLWAFPVQQLVIDLWGVQRMSVNLLVVTAITAVLALASWHLVEHPSLKLKDRIVRRFARPRPQPAPAAGTPVKEPAARS
ncbi:acyltransferase [Microbacterium sp. ARD31]|uniref:acyltransferase family protein n=1 Tax=Microbacterium sp. ARD31 TaxID=2962576 RepID=UPI002881618E|nr:acyltransferase [Microbacterium sp. ARD31]MDT0186755.1 acyltransferase [Microbacterium sp. ARD31]